jgi:hypothetical protein
MRQALVRFCMRPDVAKQKTRRQFDGRRQKPGSITHF